MTTALLIRRCILSALFGSSVLVPAFALAATNQDVIDLANGDLTERQAARLRAFCERVSEENYDKCIERQLGQSRNADRMRANETEESRRETITGVCDRVEDENRERCIARQLARAKRIADRNNAKNAYEFYDKQDWGGTYRRNQLMRQRRQNFDQAAQKRTTFRQFTPQNTLNTQLHPYLNDLYQERLNCMYERPGRTRTLCLERVQNQTRAEMQERRIERANRFYQGDPEPQAD